MLELTSMKVGIDVFCSDHGRSGIGSYIHSFVKNLYLLKENPKYSDIDFELFGSELDRFTFDSEKLRVEYKGINISDTVSSERAWHIFKLKKFAKKNKYDYLLFPAGSRMLPLSFSTKGIAVVNDVVSVLLKEKKDFLERFLLLRGLKKATKIIAASQYIRKDLIKLKINPSKIHVVYNGIDHNHFYHHSELDTESDTDLIKPFAIKKPYIIYATRISKPEKMHIELINAFTKFKEKTGLPHRLVLAGDGEYTTDLQKVIAKNPYASDIFLTGYFPHEHLPELYSCADACIFPSVVEGVGLPIIEAMATEIPVACAKAGALQEFAKDGALFFNPNNIEEFSEAIERILTDEKLRESLVEFGYNWTKHFSWEKTLQKTADLLKD